MFSLLNVLLAVETKSGETEELKTLKTMLYRGLEFEKTGGVTIDLAKLGVKVAEGAVQIGLSFIPPLATLADMAKELQKAGRTNVQSGPTKLLVSQLPQPLRCSLRVIASRWAALAGAVSVLAVLAAPASADDPRTRTGGPYDKSGYAGQLAKPPAVREASLSAGYPPSADDLSVL